MSRKGQEQELMPETVEEVQNMKRTGQDHQRIKRIEQVENKIRQEMKKKKKSSIYFISDKHLISYVYLNSLSQ